MKEGGSEMFRWWDPFREMETLRRELDRVSRVFDEVNELWRGRGLGGWRRRGLLAGDFFQPMMNLSEDKENLYVEMVTPGVEPESINVSVTGSTLTVSAERKGLEDVKPERIHRNERPVGSFTRSIELPVEVEMDKIEAYYKNGLLVITLPKAEAAKPKQIKVNVG